MRNWNIPCKADAIAAMQINGLTKASWYSDNGNGVTKSTGKIIDYVNVIKRSNTRNMYNVSFH